MPTGGSIQSVTLNGRYFSVAADADPGRNLGGFQNDVQTNGDGTSRLIKTRVPWSVSDLVLSIDDARGDQEFIQDLANGSDFFPITATYANQSVFQGSGQISGENPVAAQATTMGVSLMGTGTLTQQ